MLFVDGALAETLAPGRHCSGRLRRKVKVQNFDLRPQPLEVTAQEILTKDRIGAARDADRVLAHRRSRRKRRRRPTTSPPALYRLVQFAVREAVATRTLDEILARARSIDADIRAYVAERAAVSAWR